MKQEIKANELDRFQIVLAFGRMAAPPFREGPWGYSLIFPPVMPGTDWTAVQSANVRARLQLRYDGDRIFDSPPLAFTLWPIGYGYRAIRITGFKFEEKIAMLSDENINVVESVVELLSRIGDPAALRGLERLNRSDLSYLKDFYSNHIYKKCPNPRYYDLPAPDARFEQFKHTLDYVIKHLRSKNDKRIPQVAPPLFQIPLLSRLKSLFRKP